MEQAIGWILLIILAAGVSRIVYLRCTARRSGAERSSRSASASAPRRDPHGETGPMIYYANDNHGREDREYKFKYKWVYDAQLSAYTWRAYILRMPDLCGRPSDGHSTHRWNDGAGNHWICWDSPLTSLSEIQSVSRVWADSLQEYIATGKRFG